MRLGLGGVEGPSAGVTEHPRGVVRARPPTGAKLVGNTSQGECSGENLAFKEVVLKGQGVRRVRLPLDPLPIDCTSSASAATIPLRLLWGGARPMVRRQVCIQRPRNGGLGMPYRWRPHWLSSSDQLMAVHGTGT